MQLYTDNGQYCHQARFVIAEKGVTVAIKNLASADNDQIMHTELIKINPRLNLPTLVDEETVLTNPVVILEYLEENFPYPALLPSVPKEKAEFRERIARVNDELCKPASLLLNKKTTKRNREKARENVLSSLSDLLPILMDYEWCFSDSFGLLDCYLAPLLWRLPEMGISFRKSTRRTEVLQEYMHKVFAREGFLGSMTAAERNMR